MGDSAPQDPSGPLFGFVRRFVLVAGTIVVAAWLVAVVLWLTLRLIDW